MTSESVTVDIGSILTDFSLYVSSVNNTFATGPVVNITLDANGDIASVAPNFEPGVYYSSILEYDGLTGEFIDDFVPKGNANQDGIFLSSGITFKDGILYANDQGYQVTQGVSNPADSLYGRILKFDAATGDFLGEFISGTSLTAHGLNFPEDLLFGPDGNLYISGLGGGGVQIFNGTTGAYIKTIATENPFTGKDLIAAGLNFGPDGNLYISSVLNDNSIIRYDLDTDSLEQFISPEFAPAIPSGSVFTPDASLFLNATFVSVDGSPIGISQYNGQTGAPLDFFVEPSNNGGLNSASRMIFDTQGNLYVSDFAGSQIVHYDSQGEPINGGVFIASGVGGLNNPGGIRFNTTSDGELVVGTPGADDLIAKLDFVGVKDTVFTGAGDDEVDVPSGGASRRDNRISLGSGKDVAYASNGDRLFGDSGNDILDATDASGYRLSGGAGDDQFFLGSNGRAIGGDGNDQFWVQTGGGNVLAGGAGADQFWMLTDSPTLLTSANTITDFTPGTDVIGIAAQGDLVGFDDLTFSGNNISLNGVTFATLTGIQTNTLTSASFVFA
ncbi:hypothetical protein [Synechocystis sp. LKSZ1]|uniref:M10 family metallopeptidase C-terminal domain-containing protein n=1 Tax=Synechocystis sp. LKSZ1 TaxID=3144951 RepID=UPI00336BED34